MNWTWLRFESESKSILPHAVHDDLLDVVVLDLIARVPDAKAVIEPLARFDIDMPGMIMTTRPYMTFEFQGLPITMPCEDFGSFIVQLDSARIQECGYYLLFGFHRCMALTSEQRDLLTLELRALHPEAERRASEFYATRMVPSEVLRAAAAKTSGVPLEKVPNLGGNKADRFKLKPGGRA